MKTQFRKNIARLMVFTTLASSIFIANPEMALAWTSTSHTLSNYAAGETSTHTIQLATSLFSDRSFGLLANETLLVQLPAGFTTNGSFDASDFTISYDPPMGAPTVTMDVVQVTNSSNVSCVGTPSGQDVSVSIYHDGSGAFVIIHTCDNYYDPAMPYGGPTTFDIFIDGTSPSGELTNASTGGEQTVAYTYLNNASAIEDTGTDTITLTGGAGPGLADGSGSPRTTMNRVHLDRLQKGQTGVHFTLSFELAGTSGPADTLSIVFPSGFANVDAGSAAATCSGGGTISGWQDDDDLNAWATKADCAGTVSVDGIYVDLPTTVGSYIIRWSNDNGSGAVYIMDDDQVTVTSNVDPTMLFDIDTSIATSADTNAPYTVDFGTLDLTSTSVSGEAAINYIMVDLSTNATLGAVVTVENLNGAAGLVSTSSPSDSIANAAGAMSTGTENYGFCVQYATESLGATFAATGDYASGTCADKADGNAVKALTTTAASIFLVEGPVSGGRAVISGSATIGALTEAHDDYTDTLTFIATSTF